MPIHIHNNPPKTSLPLTVNQLKVLAEIPEPPCSFYVQDGKLNRTLRVLYREGMIFNPVHADGRVDRFEWQRTVKGSRRLAEHHE